MIRGALVLLMTVSGVPSAQAIDWTRHEALMEPGRPLLVSTSDQGGDPVSVGETVPFFRKLAAEGNACEASDGHRTRVRIVCEKDETGFRAVFIGQFVGVGQLLIQKIAVNKRMLPAGERAAFMNRIRQAP